MDASPEECLCRVSESMTETESSADNCYEIAFSGDGSCWP